MNSKDLRQIQLALEDMGYDMLVALFLDKNEDLRRIRITFQTAFDKINGRFLKISTTLNAMSDTNRNMSFATIANNIGSDRTYLELVHTDRKYRGLGAASAIINLVEVYAKEQGTNLIYGDYCPFSLDQLFVGPNASKIEKELNDKAEKFYTNSGYTIVSFEDYKKDEKKHPDRLFAANDDDSDKVIYKKLTDTNSEYEKFNVEGKGNIYINKNVYKKYPKEEILKVISRNTEMKKGI